ncbi:bax protein [Marinobacter fuscus]|uniref:Bax protein n=1 Tax=Marinobacter fuscus TaxID=2109942 RepID=A0A2T1K8U1_9GAMM|nr:glucosaminidase domain-containing protein [Marinobacter fuscus]PSF05942.1 bax protein [Marinobacter fuscus]
MTASFRALMFAVPVVAFALGGAWYQPPAINGQLPGDDAGEVQLAGLPPLPAWANERLPDFSVYRDTTEKKVAFFSFLYPRIVLANSRILLEREYLDHLAGKARLDATDKAWLTRQGERLRVNAETGSAEQFARLRKRLDVIPPSLILAQAANESAWGTSRFARKGNNLFGQWCFTQGCGLVPQSRVEGADHEVAKFASPYYSVRSYIQNLNRHPAYQTVRDIRLADRKAQNPLSGHELAEGLRDYSERGEEYVQEIRAMIRYNNLEFYDREFRALLGERSAEQFQRLASAMPESLLPPGSGGAPGTPFES